MSDAQVNKKILPNYVVQCLQFQNGAQADIQSPENNCDIVAKLNFVDGRVLGYYIIELNIMQQKWFICIAWLT